MDDLMICPINRAHIISKLRFPGHISKCKKQHPGIELSTCPYNATHMFISKDLFEQHLKECKEKVLLEPWRYDLRRDQQHGDLTPTPYDTRSHEFNDEWN